MTTYTTINIIRISAVTISIKKYYNTYNSEQESQHSAKFIVGLDAIGTSTTPLSRLPLRSWAVGVAQGGGRLHEAELEQRVTRGGATAEC
jgi:hypothetical protein